MNDSDLRRLCGEYGDWFARNKFKGLNNGWASENIIYRMMQGFLSMGASSQAIYVEETPVYFQLLEGVLNELKIDNPDEHEVFVMHWCIYFLKGERLNIKQKQKYLKIPHRTYYDRLKRAMDKIKIAYNELEENEKGLEKVLTIRINKRI